MDDQALPLECNSIALPGIEKEETPIPIYQVNENTEYHKAAIIHKLSCGMVYKTKLILFRDRVIQKTILTKNDKIIHSDEHEVGYSTMYLFNAYCTFKNNDNFAPEYIYDAVYEDVISNIECRKKVIEKDTTDISNVHYYAVYPSQYDKFFRTLESRVFLLGFLLGKLKNDNYDCFIVGDTTKYDNETHIHVNL